MNSQQMRIEMGRLIATTVALSFASGLTVALVLVSLVALLQWY